MATAQQGTGYSPTAVTERYQTQDRVQAGEGRTEEGVHGGVPLVRCTVAHRHDTDHHRLEQGETRHMGGGTVAAAGGEGRGTAAHLAVAVTTVEHGQDEYDKSEEA